MRLALLAVPLVSVLVGCAASPGPRGLSTRRGNETLTCPRDHAARPKVVTTAEACAADPVCAPRAGLVSKGRALLLVTPDDLGQRLTLEGPPTSTGTEWRVHEGIPVACEVGGRQVPARAAPDAGGGSVAYVVEVAAGADVGLCHCGE